MLMTWGDSPMGATAPPDWRGKILHASMTVGDGRLVGADVLPGGYEPPRGFSLLLGMTNLAEAESVFTALAEQGTVSLPLQQTFWAARYGIVVDQFGVTWEINCSGEEPHRGPTLDRHR
jgi:PhnB protein